jgi:DNA-binding protein YbaB
MDPREDLSTRADFTYDLMQAMSKKAQEAVDSADELVELKKTSRVNVRVQGTLQSISVDITITPLGEEPLPQEELVAAKDAVAKKVNEAIKSSMADMLQGSMTSARKRM